ncbi:MAG: S-methyl-5-thioribose kinase [Candidatus Nanopelagicales bacterium]
MTEETVAAYIRTKSNLAEHIDITDTQHVRELSDGNLNLVFLVRDSQGRSVIVKQGLPYVRVDPSWPMDSQRTSREARALALHAAVDPGHVPRVFAFDEVANVLVLEDLTAHRVWRTALLAGERHERVAAELGRYVARIGFGTSVLGDQAGSVKDRAAASTNVALCAITEALIFTEPFIEHPHNQVPASARNVWESLIVDPRVLASIAQAKWTFMTRQEALIHGDLHTGSVFASPDGEARAFDIEFAFYGPLGFDLGILWGNLVLAAARAFAVDDPSHAEWCLTQVRRSWVSFETEMKALWPTRVDASVWNDDFLHHLLSCWSSDAFIFAGTEVVRRTVGFAKAAEVADDGTASARLALAAGHALLATAPITSGGAGLLVDTALRAMRSGAGVHPGRN